MSDEFKSIDDQLLLHDEGADSDRDKQIFETSLLKQAVGRDPSNPNAFAKRS
jgi:hypothetical protein